MRFQKKKKTQGVLPAARWHTGVWLSKRFISNGHLVPMLVGMRWSKEAVGTGTRRPCKHRDAEHTSSTISTNPERMRKRRMTLDSEGSPSSATRF